MSESAIKTLSAYLANDERPRVNVWELTRQNAGCPEWSNELRHEAEYLWMQPSLNESQLQRVQWFRDYYGDKEIKGNGNLDNLAPRHFVNMLYGLNITQAKAGVPEKYIATNLEGFDAPTAEHLHWKGIIGEYIDRLLAGKLKKKGLVMFGPVGSGKSYMLSIIARHYCEMGQRHEWIDSQDYIAKLRDAITSGGVETIRHEIASIPVLFLDDLGKERMSEFAIDHLTYLIDYREKHDSPTYIATNLDCGPKPHQDSRCEFGRYIGDRIFSRLHSLCAFLGPTPSYDWRRGVSIGTAQQGRMV